MDVEGSRTLSVPTMKIPTLGGGFPSKRQFVGGQHSCKIVQSRGTMFYTCTTMRLRASDFSIYRFETWLPMDGVQKPQIRLSQKRRVSDRWLFDLAATLPKCFLGGGKGVNYTNRGMIL